MRLDYNRSMAQMLSQSLQALEVEVGEPLLYRVTGRFLGAQGVEAPLDVWGLVVLTPTRIVFRHFAQAHPLLGRAGEEVRWECPRATFATCDAVLPSWAAKVFSGALNHVSLRGEGLHLTLETADPPQRWAQAWTSS